MAADDKNTGLKSNMTIYLARVRGFGARRPKVLFG
jgi:hypothetical protein